METALVDRDRIHPLNRLKTFGPGEIIYWMSREQRLDDNWSFLFALELAAEHGREVSVVCTLPASGETLRSASFLIGGLMEVENRARDLGLRFSVLAGSDSAAMIKSYAESRGAGAVVCDFDPLRLPIMQRETFAGLAAVPVFEVDSHNIIPCRLISAKQEYSAYTLRRKIEPLLARFLVPHPSVDEAAGRIVKTCPSTAESILWDNLTNLFKTDNTVLPVTDIKPGYRSGMDSLERFIGNKLDSYNNRHNDPNADGQSGLSSYLHFGHISPQTAARAAARCLGDAGLKGGFLDEIIVRRELSDNYCFYNPGYDSEGGFPAWAKTSLNFHSVDRREYLYNSEDFEKAKTHDPLWNAAQNQMRNKGIMHGYLRMYWAKKILEWSPSAGDAMRTAVYLNDKYSLDGRDPNGYAGCAWSIGGLHDRAWSDRPVFGKVRYMNERGCRRKFDVDAYIKSNQP